MKAKHHILLILIGLPLLFSAAFASKADAIKGKVMQVKDGDTAVIAPIEGGQFFICRLYGIDAPEIGHNGRSGQQYGSESETALKNLVLGQEVSIEVRDRDKYGREVCIIRKDGRDINKEMIVKGAAWAYRKYLKPPYAAEYIEAEGEAKAKRHGLWQQNYPEAPWEFRKR